MGDRNKTDLPYDHEEDSDCEWYRLRNEEALDADSVVALCRAAKEKYGFKDFKLKHADNSYDYLLKSALRL